MDNTTNFSCYNFLRNTAAPVIIGLGAAAASATAIDFVAKKIFCKPTKKITEPECSKIENLALANTCTVTLRSLASAGTLLKNVGCFLITNLPITILVGSATGVAGFNRVRHFISN